MNKKTTARIIHKKMNSWLKTIKDEELRKDVSESLIVSGGCIASLLSSEDVNDYDVYIRSMDVLMRLTTYYGITGYDGREAERLLEEYDAARPDNSEESAKGIFLRNMKPDQVKLDVDSSGHLTEYKEENEVPYRLIFTSQNAMSLSDDLQIVTRFTGTAEEIHKNYDFVHATNYFTMEDGLVCNEKALMSLLTKTLYYQGSLYPLTSIIRMKKFILRKWQINAGEILKIIFQISKLDLEDIDVLEEQLIGVDVAYFASLISTLRGGQGLTEEFLREEIEKLFN